MTLALDDEVHGSDDSPTTSDAARRPPSDRTALLRVILAVVMPPIGAVLIVLSHHHAAGLEQPDALMFALFWAGFLGGMLSLIWLACARATAGATRALALIGIGLFSMLPRVVHFVPVGSDEYIHLRQAMETYLNGDVGHTLKLLPITKEFFGLHQAASAFAHLGEIPLWVAAMSVVVLAHVLSLLGIYQLVRMVNVPAAGAAVGAVIYSLNPSWMYFNVAFSYESLASPLLVWCLAAAVAAGRGTQRLPVRAIAAAILVVAVLPMTHHLSTIMLVLILAVLIGARLVPWFPMAASGSLDVRRERIWPLVLIWSSLIASIAFWWAGKYDWLINYLGPALSEGYAQLQRIIEGVSKSTSGQRSLFANAQNPMYEIVSGYLFPFVTLALFLWALAVLWRNRRRVGSTPWAFAVVGAMFFASMPMLLTSGGAEGAHRSWGFSFIGIAVMCGFAWSFGPRTPGLLAARWSRAALTFAQPTFRVGVAVAVYVVMVFGGAALGVTVSHRFPGSSSAGDDARAATNEGRAVADWFAAHVPADTPVMADRYVSTLAGSLGRVSALRPSKAFPVWDIYMTPGPLRPEVLKMIWDSKIGYFVVDSRMATIRPKSGTWFVKDEPGRGTNSLVSQAALDRFNCLPWLTGVFAAGTLTVYEVDRDALRRTEALDCERPAV